MMAPGSAHRLDGGAIAQLSASVRYALSAGLLLVGVADLAAIDLVLLPRYVGGAPRFAPVLPVPPAATGPSSQAAFAPPPAPEQTPPPPAEPAPAAPAPAPPKVAENPAPTFPNLLFARNTSWLSPAARETLARLAATLAEQPSRRVAIDGHTDNSGPEELNRALSLERARRCGDWLEDRGVDPTRIEIQGFGSSRPLEGDRTPVAQAHNRRVEIDLR